MHMFAHILSEDSGSTIETQNALDHEHVGTTRAYVPTIAVKKISSTTASIIFKSSWNSRRAQR
jgi:hypothetical protein